MEMQQTLISIASAPGFVIILKTTTPCQTSFIRLIKSENLLELFAEINVSDYTASTTPVVSPALWNWLTFTPSFMQYICRALTPSENGWIWRLNGGDRLSLSWIFMEKTPESTSEWMRCIENSANATATVYIMLHKPSLLTVGEKHYISIWQLLVTSNGRTLG